MPNTPPPTNLAPAAPPVVAAGIIPKKIRVIGVPLDLGASRRGVDMGPSAVRVAGLEARLEQLGHVVEDGGNVSHRPRDAIAHRSPGPRRRHPSRSSRAQSAGAPIAPR